VGRDEVVGGELVQRFAGRRDDLLEEWSAEVEAAEDRVDAALPVSFRP
jgi:hypothetical protein